MRLLLNAELWARLSAEKDELETEVPWLLLGNLSYPRIAASGVQPCLPVKLHSERGGRAHVLSDQASMTPGD